MFNSDTDEHMKIGFSNDVPNSVVKALPDDKTDTSTYKNVDSVKSLIERHNLDGICFTGVFIGICDF